MVAKKLSLGVLAMSLFFINAISQEKMLTIEDAIMGQYGQFYPEYLSSLTWRQETDTYTYLVGSVLTEAVPGKKGGIPLLSLEDLNLVLQQAGVEPFQYFPMFEWRDKTTLQLFTEDHIYYYNVTTKKVIFSLTYDQSADNHDFCKENKMLAYTLKNNLFIVGEKGTSIAVTNDSNPGIVNGQTVHRNEFGIEKGTFWSPKGNLLAFYRMDESMVTDYPLVDVTQRIATVDNKKYPMAGMASHQVTVGIYYVATGKTIFLNTGEPKEQYLTNLSWDPDEKFMYIAVLNRDQNLMKMNKYDAQTGAFVKTLFEVKNDKYVEPLAGLVFLKSKPNEFLWESDMDGYNHIYRYNTEGKLLAQLTKGNWIVDKVIGMDPQEKNLFFISTQESPIQRHVYKVDLATAKIIKLSKEVGVHKAQLSSSGKYLLCSYSNVSVPKVTYIMDGYGKLLEKVLESPNPLAGYELGEMKLFTIKSADEKTDLHCRMILPVDFDPSKKYPAIVYVYGGPHAQMILNSWLAEVSLWEFYMAQKGYVMFTVDNRGSAGRGREFEDIIFRNLGAAEMADQMKGIDYLRSLGYVDMERIGVHGWSYGGFMTTSLLLKHNDVFKVGVAGGPVIDWKYYEIMYGERYMDTPEDNAEGYKNANLLEAVDSLKGKLLLIHGCQDPVVVWQHSLVFINECIRKNKQLDCFVYPLHEHNIRGKDRVHLMQKVTQYFDDFL